MEEQIPTFTDSYRDIKSVTSMWSVGDSNSALAQGAVLLAVRPNPDAEDFNDAFCLLLGLPDHVNPTPNLRRLFGLGN